MKKFVYLLKICENHQSHWGASLFFRRSKMWYKRERKKLIDNKIIQVINDLFGTSFSILLRSSHKFPFEMYWKVGSFSLCITLALVLAPETHHTISALRLLLLNPKILFYKVRLITWIFCCCCFLFCCCLQTTCLQQGNGKHDVFLSQIIFPLIINSDIFFFLLRLWTQYTKMNNILCGEIENVELLLWFNNINFHAPFLLTMRLMCMN